jgi:hypothetical protein
MTEVSRSEFFCAGTNRQGPRKGERCRRLGHRRNADGVRWCATHAPETTVKDVIACAGVRSDGSPCATPANEVIHVDGVDRPTCEFHAGLYAETGSLRPISRRTRRRRAQEERERHGNVNVAGGTVRDRVVATAHGVYDRMEQVLVAAMSATKIVTFPCKSCGVKNRVEVSDYTNALRSVELMLAKSAATPKDAAAVAFDEAALIEIPVAEMDGAQLYRSIFGTRPATVDGWSGKERTAKVELIVDVSRRMRANPNNVSHSEHWQAYWALDGIRQLLEQYEPLRGVELPTLPELEKAKTL